VKHVLEIVDLEGFEKRRVSTLSGGQQQRIAIARALVNEPEILLLDEPLGALDLKMRKEMQLELKNMHDQLGITFIYVTHDQEEALTMSDKIVVMSEGKVQQIGTPEDIYNEPKNAFVADFIGDSNIFKGIMTGDKRVRFCGGEFVCVDDVPEGTLVDVVVRPEDVILTAPEQGTVEGVVTSVIFKGIRQIRDGHPVHEGAEDRRKSRHVLRAGRNPYHDRGGPHDLLRDGGKRHAPP
jgi:spermidine/putrescine transport system ATP-binding protein